MHTVNTLRRALGLIGLSVLLIQGMGCNKMYAKYNVKSAQKRVEQSKALKAEQLANDLMIQANNLINTAVSQINSQDFKSAVATSKQATAKAKELLIRTKAARAKQLREEADYWLKKADLNRAEVIDQAHINQYKQNNEKGIKYYDKESYDKAIGIFQLVVNDVNFLLKPLADEAKAGLEETKQMKEELIKEGAPKYAPKYVEDLAGYITQITNFNDQDRNYREALRFRDLAKQTKGEGILKTQEAKSKEMLTEIENLLDMATTLGADIYALQNFKSCSKEFNNLLTQFYDKVYPSVLVAAPVLKPKVEALIVETKREAANAKAKEVEKNVNQLVDSKARTYLPGRVEQLETLLTQARQLFKDQNYDESKKISERGLELYQNILSEFNSLAEQEIKKASDVLATGEDVYRRMVDIFDKKIQGKLANEDQRLEEAKQAMKEELRVKLQNARISLEMASVKRQDKDFDLAIEMAKQVAISADDVHQQTYRVVAHNAILEIANELSRLERDGGRQYAASETDKTLKLLEVSKVMLHGGKYRDAVKQAADTRAQLAVLTQELGRVAVKRIETAQESLTSAKGNRAEQYQNDTFNQAIVALDRARASLDGEGLHQAIESAKQAEQLAAAASEKALKQWALEEIRRSDVLLGKARQAGAINYAPEKMQKAVGLRATLQTLYDQASYKQAIGVGEETVEAADAAFYAKVNEADAEIATAKRYEGWEQEPRSLAEALISAKNAREMMDKGSYDLGLQHAQGAIVQAKTVAKAAKRKSFEVRMAALQKHLEGARENGAGYYQTKDLTKIMSEMNRLKNEFEDTSYEDLAQGVEKLESQLAGVMEMTPDVLKNLVESLQTRLSEMEKRRAKALMQDKVEEVERRIKFAQIDFKTEKYRSSYQNAHDAAKLLDTIAVNLDERDFDRALNIQMESFNKQLEKFSPVLNVGSPALIQMASGPQGRIHAVAIMNASSPSDLVTQINEIGARVRAMTTPSTRTDVRAAALKMLTMAKASASNFEKFLILDQYNTKDARAIIEVAFLQMHQARTQQQDVQRALKYPQPELLQPRGVEPVVTYHGE